MRRRKGGCMTIFSITQFEDNKFYTVYKDTEKTSICLGNTLQVHGTLMSLALLFKPGDVVVTPDGMSFVQEAYRIATRN